MSSLAVNAASLLLAAGLAGFAGESKQPLEFPHNKHLAQGLRCVDCHVGGASGTSAGLPSIQKCMSCHEAVALDRPGVKMLQRYYKQKREIPWVRVYAFGPGSFVKFEHSPHARAGIECKSCHGDMAGMTVARPVVRHNMGTCISCHRERHASDDCAACHF